MQWVSCAQRRRDDSICMRRVLLSPFVCALFRLRDTQIIISINLGVHVLLYAYYGLYELKVDIWWKKVSVAEEGRS